MTLSFAQLRHEWLIAGGAPREADTAAAVAKAESHGNNLAVNHSDPYGGSFCAFQINAIHPFDMQALTHDPYLCAMAAVYVHHKSGWGAWSTYRYGQYKAFLPHHARPANSHRMLQATPRTLHARHQKPLVGHRMPHVRPHPTVVHDPLAALPWQFVGALGLMLAFNALRQIPRAFGIAMRHEIAIIKRTSRRKRYQADAAYRKRTMPRAQRRLALNTN